MNGIELSDDELLAKLNEQEGGTSTEEVPPKSMGDDELLKRLNEEEHSRKIRKYYDIDMIGEGRTYLGTDENGADMFDYDAEHAPAFAPQDDEGKALHEKVKGYKGGTLSHRDRPFRVNRGEDGKIASYSTTESTVVPEIDGTWSVIPTLWKDKSGEIVSAKDDEEAAVHYRDTELHSSQKPGEKVGERFGNFATEEEARAAAQDIHNLHSKMYQQKWNQYLNEHWDEVGDEIKNAPGMKKAHEAWEKAGRPGVRFSMSEPEDRSESGDVPESSGDVQEAKGEPMGIGEHARLSLQAKTGKKYDTAYYAILRHMAPFGTQSEGVDANAKTAALEKLRSGDFADDEVEYLGPIALGPEYDEIMRVTAGGEEGRRRAYLSMAATDALVEQTKNKQDAKREINFRPQTWYGKVISPVVENFGYVSSFAYGSLIIPTLSLEGAAGWGLLGRKAANTVFASSPVSFAGAVERTGDLMNKSYKVDGADNLKVVDDNYGELESIWQGTKGSVAENIIVEGMTDIVIDAALLGLSRIPGVRNVIIPTLKGMKASAVRKMMQSGGGRFLLKAGDIYGKFKNVTQIHSIPSEQLEEIIQPIFDDVIGLSKKKGEESQTLGEYAKDMFTLQNQMDILCGLIGTVVLQGAASAALARRPKQYAKDVKTARQQLVDAGADEKQVSMLDDESALQCANAFVYMSQSPENLKKFTEKMDGASQAIMDQVMSREGANFGAELEGMGIAPRSFKIPTRTNAETGKVEPDFKQMRVTSTLNGNEFDVDHAVWDDETGVCIIDNGKSAGEDRRFSVWSPNGSADFMSIAAAQQYATNRMREIQLYMARDEKKAQYIENERREKFGNANVEQYRTVEEAIEASKAHGVDVSKDKNFNRNRKGWHAKDAAGNDFVILVRNNISSPWQVQRVLRHEVIGHSGTANGVTFLDDVMHGSNDARAKIEKSLENGPVSGGVDRAIREGVANTLQQRSHHASGLQKRVAAVRGWLRGHGFKNLGMSDAELEARVEQIEKEMVGTKGKFEIGKTFSAEDFATFSEIPPAPPPGSAESADAPVQESTENSQQSENVPEAETAKTDDARESAGNPPPTASAEEGSNKETSAAPSASTPVSARSAETAAVETPKTASEVRGTEQNVPKKGKGAPKTSQGVPKAETTADTEDAKKSQDSDGKSVKKPASAKKGKGAGAKDASRDKLRRAYAEERGGKAFRHRVENGRLLNKPPTKNVRRPGKKGGFKTQFVGDDPAVEVLNHIYDGLNGDERRRMNELLFGEYPVGTSRVGNDAMLDIFNSENGTDYTIEQLVDELLDENGKFEEWEKGGALSLEEEMARDAEERERSSASEQEKGEGKEFSLESVTAKQLEDEKRRREEQAEIKRRQEAPLKGGSIEVGQSLLDLGGAEGEDLFNRTQKASEPAPKKPGKAEAAKKPSIATKSEAEERRVKGLDLDAVTDKKATDALNDIDFFSEELLPEIDEIEKNIGLFIDNRTIDIRLNDGERSKVIAGATKFFADYSKTRLPLSTGRILRFEPSQKTIDRHGSILGAWTEYAIHAVTNDNVGKDGKHYRVFNEKKSDVITSIIPEIVAEDKTIVDPRKRNATFFHKLDDRHIAKVIADFENGDLRADLVEVTSVYQHSKSIPNGVMPLERAVQELIRKEDATISEPDGDIIAQRGAGVNSAVPEDEMTSSVADARLDREISRNVDFDTEEFDYEKFGKLVTGVGKLVDVLSKAGHRDFASLVRFIASKDVEKYERAKVVLQDVWNAVARQKGLSRVSDDAADEVYGKIDAERKETDNARRMDSDTGAGSDGDHVNGSDAGVRAGGDESAGGLLAGGHVRGQNPDGRVDGVRAGGVSGRAQGLADQDAQREELPEHGKASEGNEPVGNLVESEVREHEARGDRGSAVAAKAANKAAKPGPGSTDFVMTPAVEAAIVEKSPIKRVRNNVAAIRLIQQLKQRDFKATPEEQEVLAKYVGWGGLSEIFSRNYERAYDAEKAIASGGHAWVEPEAEISAAKYGREGYEAYKEIRQTLNDDEYASAKRTVLTAFYTPIQMVRAEHAALRKLGVLGGRVLGPSAGVGNYASAAGEYKKGLDWQFVELDEVSGNILRALFPNQLVHVGGFEETKFADSFFDFAIDNVPYADVDISDKSLMKSPLKIHDYFFAKTLSKIRPGGVIMFLTSTGTLDKTNGVLRQFLSKNGGKIVGAVRLPNGFFSANAGTDVASDLVVIQKVDGEADNSSFMKQEPYGYDTEYVRRKGTVKVPLTYNGYFKEHPEQVIGEMKAGTGQYGRPVLEYRMPKGDMFAKVGDAIDRAMSGIDRDMLLKNVTPAVQKDHTPVYDSEGLRQGNVAVKDGTVYEKSGTDLSPVALPKQSKDAKKRFMKKGLTPQKVVERIVGVRKALRAVVDAEVAGVDDGNLSGLLKNLNDVYDSFAKDVGWFHDPSITPFVLLDKADGNRLMALENKRKVDGKDVLEKADIFKRRVIFTYQKPTKAETTDEALVISYSETGAIDMERIGGLLGVSAEEAEKRLKEEGKAFENPQTGRIEPYWEYLSGHVRRKLDAARAAVQSDAAFKKNVEELEKVQPKDVSLDEVKIKFGNTWVDTEAMVDFLREAYGLSKYARMSLKRSEITNKWSVELPRTDVQPFGSISFTQQHFLENVLNSATLEVREKDPVTEKYFVLERETEAQRLAAEKLHDAFARFLRTSEKWFEPSGRAFNYAMNDNVQMVLPNNILPLRAAGMSEDFIKKLGAKDREYQPAVIARGVLGGRSLCLAHCVGAGKTLEMQTIGMVGRHLGMFNKSMYVVPNHMLDQFCNEFLGAFPNANILKMSTEDVSPKNRRAFFAKVANGDWDAIVVKHSTFSQKLPMTVEWQKQFIQREIGRLVEAKLAAKGDSGTVKDIERMVAKAEEKIKKLDSSDKKDSEIVPFEELGVDQLFVDEAHNFKGLPVMSMQARKTKGLQQNDSQRALDMEMKATYVQSLHGGRRGVVFATGTPLSNAPVVEAYVMLRYLSPWAMEEQNVNNFDDFVNTFGNIETVTAFGTDGKSTHEEQRITSFVNIPEMMRLFKGAVDIVNSDQIKVPRPAQKMEPVAVPMSDAQAKIMEMVAEESAKPVTKEDQGKFLTLTQIAKLACISPRLVGIEDDGKKLVACASKVKEVYDETGSDNGAQLVFTDIFNNSDAAGVQKYVGAIEGLEHSSKSWNLNKHLKDLLVASGIPAEQIAIIHDIDKEKGEESKDAAKEKIFAKVRSGEIRVLIGSRAKMGEGTNVQERLAAIHLLHPGWKPSEDTQAIGRIIRPGNMYKTGRVFYYLTQGNANVGSYETKNHELIGVKDRLINLVMHGDETVREMDLDEASVERDMLMGLASANQDLIRLIDVKRALHKAELNTESVAFSARSNSDNADRTERNAERMREEFESQERGAKAWREKNPDGSFVLTTADGRSIEKMKDMADYVSAQVVKQLQKERYDREERLEIGSFNGIPLVLSSQFSDGKMYLSIPSIGYAREISYSGFLPDFNAQSMTAFRGRVLGETAADIEDVHKDRLDEMARRVKKLREDAARFNAEYEQEKGRLSGLRTEKARLERSVTPLIVKATENNEHVAYGNWDIRRKSGKYSAIRTTDGTRLSAPTVKALLPMMDEADFADPMKSAVKTEGIKDEGTRDVKPADVDFDTEELAESKSEEMKRISDKFDKELQRQIDGTLDEGHIYNLGRPGSILRSTGIPDLPIQLTAKRLRFKGDVAHHPFNISEIKGLVRHIQDPVAVFAYGDKNKAQNIVVEIRHGGKNFVVGMSMRPTVNGSVLDINSIRTLFPKNNHEWMNWINQGKLLYVNKKKIQVLFDQYQTNPGNVAYFDLDLVKSISQNFVNPQVSSSAGVPKVDFDTEELNDEERRYAESEDKTSTADVMRDVFGMTNAEIATALRAAGMEPPKHQRKTDEQLMQQANVLLSNPSYMAKLSRAVYRVARPVSDYENVALNILLRQREEDVNERKAVVDDILATPENQAAVDPDYKKNLEAARKSLSEANALMRETAFAASRAASEQGRALRSNRIRLDRNDYSYAGILGSVQRELGSAEVPADIEDQVEELANEFKKLDDDERALATARLKAFSEKLVANLRSGTKMKRAVGTRKLMDEARRVTRNYADALAQIEVGAAEVGGTLIGLSDQMYPAWGRWLKHLGEYHCFNNPDITEDEMIAAILEDISPFMDGVDANQIRDALTGFGHNYKQSRYESQRLMNDLRAQARMKRQLDWMNENGTLPPTTGMIRDDLSAEARDLARQVQEKKKETPEGAANSLKSALDSAKKRIRNRIEDLERAIASGEAIERTKRSAAEDAELRQLKAERDDLQKKYDEIFGTVGGMTEEQRVKAVEKALSNALERANADLARAMAGDFSKPAKRRVDTETANALRDEIRRVRESILALKKASYEYGMTPEEINERNARKLRAREDALSRLTERIERGDIRPYKKPQPPMTPEQQKKYDEMGEKQRKARARLAQLRLEAQHATSPKWVRKTAGAAKFVTTLIRATMATADFSAVLRQSATISLGHPKMALKSFGLAWESMKSDDRLAEINGAILSDESIKEAIDKYGLNMRSVDADDARDAEIFHGVERNTVKIRGKEYALTDIPLFGKLLLKSERHYITYLNSVSAELYKSIVNDRVRFPNGPSPWQKKIICDLVNIWNGSGALSKERRAALMKSGVNEVFWAPGLAVSRFQSALGYDIIHNFTAEGLDAKPVSKDERVAVAKIAVGHRARFLASSVALGLLFAALKWDSGDWDEWWNDADVVEKFMMLTAPVVGNTTIDLTGGERTVTRFVHDYVKGERRTARGKIQELGKGFAVPTRTDLVMRFARGKFSPALSMLFALADGKDYVGKEFGLKEAALSLIPLSASDIYDQLDQNGIWTTFVTAPLTLLGAGGTTYER